MLECFLISKQEIKGDILKAYRKIHTKLVLQGWKPRLQMLDNETSTILLNYMKKNLIDVQLAPPHMHRQNLAERTIHTLKEHFIKSELDATLIFRSIYGVVL